MPELKDDLIEINTYWRNIAIRLEIYIVIFFHIYCLNGARGRTRTGTKFPSRDFKSLVSTNSTTRAINFHIVLSFHDFNIKLEAEVGIEPA